MQPIEIITYSNGFTISMNRPDERWTHTYINSKEREYHILTTSKREVKVLSKHRVDAYYKEIYSYPMGDVFMSSCEDVCIPVIDNGKSVEVIIDYEEGSVMVNIHMNDSNFKVIKKWHDTYKYRYKAFIDMSEGMLLVRRYTDKSFKNVMKVYPDTIDDIHITEIGGGNNH